VHRLKQRLEPLRNAGHLEPGSPRLHRHRDQQREIGNATKMLTQGRTAQLAFIKSFS
jgi:hypothetical protein